MQVLLGGKPAVLDSSWKPARDTELILAEVAAAQAQRWSVLESISTPEGFGKAWDFYLLVSITLVQPVMHSCLGNPDLDDVPCRMARYVIQQKTSILIMG